MRVPPLTAAGPLVVLLGCLTEEASGGKPVPFDEGNAPTLPGDSGTPPPAEECNGVDDDGDGVVDEGFPDADANGLADCLQADCSGVTPSGGHAVEADPATLPWDQVPVVDPWDVEVAWEVVEVDGDQGVPFESLFLPVVLPPGDPSGVKVFSGATSAARWYDDRRAVAFGISPSGEVVGTFDGLNYAQNVAWADVNRDGSAQTFLCFDDDSAGAVRPDGTVLWRSGPGVCAGWSSAAIRDLHGDGTPEVLLGHTVYDAVTGAELFGLDANPMGDDPAPAAADLDLDGTPEILFCDTVYDVEGNPLWASPMGDVRYSSPVVVQADLDPEAEVAFVHGRMVVHDTDGTELATSEEMGQPVSGPPCAGDLDGDGEMEVVVANMDTLYAFELDGTTRWAVSVSDPSSRAGCSVADLDGDGRVEVLYMDEVSFGIYDGSTGAALYLDATVISATGVQFPTTADLDGDGHTEILVSMGDFLDTQPGTPMLRVYRHAGDGWTPGGAIWPFSDYSMAEANEDGTIPRYPEPAWSRYGVFRGRLASLDSHPLAADLSVALEAVCVEDCVDGPVVLSVQVTNAGTLAVPKGTRLAVYAVQEGTPSLLVVSTLPELAAGTAAPGVLLELDPGGGLAGATLRVVVDDDGTGAGAVREPDEADNVAEWSEVVCG